MLSVKGYLTVLTYQIYNCKVPSFRTCGVWLAWAKSSNNYSLKPESFSSLFLSLLMTSFIASWQSI